MNGKKVWRLLPGQGVLVAELRNADEKTTEFAGIDLSSGSLLWRNNREKEWWTTLNVVFKDTILLQEFARPDMPTSSKIFVLDLHTGKLLWQNHDVSFMAAKGDTIFCLKKSFTSDVVIGLNFRTGKQREVATSDLPDENYSYQSEFVLPEPIDNRSESPQGQTILNMLARTTIPPDSKDLTFLRIGEKTVIGFYSISRKSPKDNPLYEAQLIVTDKKGKIIFEDIVERGIHVPLADFYFGVGERLIYVRNSEEIVAVKLG